MHCSSEKVGLFTRLYCRAQCPINAQFDGVMQLCDYPHKNDAHKIPWLLIWLSKHPHAQRLFESFLLRIENVFTMIESGGIRTKNHFLYRAAQRKLHGWWFPAKKPCKGDYCIFHGNTENLTSHYQLAWITDEGYNLSFSIFRLWLSKQTHTQKLCRVWPRGGRLGGKPSVDLPIITAVWGNRCAPTAIDKGRLNLKLVVADKYF